jgi:hypothetical protein
MNLWPPLIVAAVAAVWWFLTGGKDPVTGSAPRYLPQAPSGGSAFAAPGTTGQPGAFNVNPPITVQPNTASSGVPTNAPQNTSFQNNEPGPKNINRPFQPFGTPIPLGGVNRPNYGSNRNVLDWNNLAKTLNPFNIPGSNTAPRKSGCGCSGNTSGAPNGCGGCAKVGSCAGTPLVNGSYPAPNQLINIPDIPMVRGPNSPMTLASQIANLATPYMNNFTAYQFGENIAEENQGFVPAAPTHGAPFGMIPPGPVIPY